MVAVSENTWVRGPDGTTHRAGDLARMFGVPIQGGQVDVPQGSIVQSKTKTVPTPVGIRIPETPLPGNTQQVGGSLFTGGINGGSGGVTQVAPAESVVTADRSREASSAALLLRQYGLEALIPIVDQWIRGGMSWEQAQLQFYDTGTDAGRIFDARFPAIRQRREKGLAPLSPADYVNYEAQARQIMRAAGLPAGFYDTADDYTNLLVGDVSIAELNDRINQGYVQVANAPREVREAFAEFFGPNGDGALAAYFLDASKAVPVLQEEAEIAQIGGASKAFGYKINKSRATQIQEAGVTGAQARAGFDTIGSMDGLFNETITETVDYTAEGAGVDAIFGLDAGKSKKDLTDRLEGRVAKFSGQGGAGVGEGGVFGLGKAKR